MPQPAEADPTADVSPTPDVLPSAGVAPTVSVTGTIVGPDGTVVPVTLAELHEYEFEGAEPIRSDIVVAEDGTFTVELREWGTADAPARADIWAEGVFGEEEVDDHGCVVVRWPVGKFSIEIPGVVPLDPIVLVMDMENSIGACTATPAPSPDIPAPPNAPGITLPPTDVAATPPTPGAAIGWLGLVLLAFSAATAVLRPRRSSGRRP